MSQESSAASSLGDKLVRRFQGNWKGLLAIYLGAVAARLLFLWQPPYHVEAGHFSLARQFGHADPSVRYLFDEQAVDAFPLFMQNSAFYGALAIPAQAGFLPFRLVAVLWAALLPVFTLLLLRRMGVDTAMAYGAACVVAILPPFVLWGARAFPAAAFLTTMVALLWAHVDGRPTLAGILAVATAWMDRTGLALVALLLGVTIWRGWRAGESRIWPLELTKPQSAYLVGALVGFVPYARYIHFQFEPGRVPDSNLNLIQGLYLSVWLLFLVVVGLRWRETRNWSVLALLWGVLVFAEARSKSLGPLAPSHAIVPAYFAVLAATFVASRWARQGGAFQSRRLLLAAVALTALFGGTAIAPAGGTMAAVLLAPPDSDLAPRLQDAWADNPTSYALDAATHLDDQRWSRLFLVDVQWYNVYHPFHYALRPESTRYVSSAANQPFEAWIAEIENNQTATIVAIEPTTFNQRLREAYAPCVEYSNPGFVLLNGSACRGLGAALARA